jgi:hypothetical protein
VTCNSELLALLLIKHPQAFNGALCFFNMDHIFPNSRGGYTVQYNLLALSKPSNASKGPHLHNAIIKVLKDKQSATVVRDLKVEVKALKTKTVGWV